MSEPFKQSGQANNITPPFSEPVEIPESVKSQTFNFDPSLVETKRDLTEVKVDGKPIAEVPTKVETTGPESSKATKDESKPVDPDKPKSSESAVDPAVVVKSDSTPAPATAAEGKKDETASKKITQISPVKKDGQGGEQDVFDYTKYAADEQDMLKNMSKKARERVVKMLDERKSLEKLKDASYLQHEQAYVLSPKFQELQTKTTRAKVEGRIWEQALLDIRAGKKYREITGFDTNGRPVMSEERMPTDRDEIRLQGNVMACQQAEQRFVGELSQYQVNHSKQIIQDLQAIENEQRNRFAWVADQTLLDHTLDVDGVGEKKVREVVQDFKSLFPDYLANTPGVNVAANLFVALQIQSAQLRQLQTQSKVATVKKSEERLVEPSSDRSGATDGAAKRKGIPSTFSIEGIPTR